MVIRRRQMLRRDVMLDQGFMPRHVPFCSVCVQTIHDRVCVGYCELAWKALIKRKRTTEATTTYVVGQESSTQDEGD